MWRLLLGRAHPDAGGEHQLFVWATAVREHVLAIAERSLALETRSAPAEAKRGPRRGPEPASAPDGDRVPFEVTCWPGRFDELTDRALATSGDLEEPYAGVLGLLADCREEYNGPLFWQQTEGATYKQLGLIARRWGMTNRERTRWYQLAEVLTLSQRHANHILQRLREKPRKRS